MPKSNPVPRRTHGPKNRSRLSSPTDLRLANILNELIQRFEAEQQDNLLRAASLMADACEHDRLIYLFGGGGHTCLVMQELFWRAGGLANLCPMIDFSIHPVTPAYMYLGHERMHEVGNHIVDYYGNIAAAYLSLVEVSRHTGIGDSAIAGLRHLVRTLGAQQVSFQAGAQPVFAAIDGRGQPVLDFLPNFALGDLALMIFIVPVAIGWWANWYPGSEPGGGSYIAQRMLSSKSEKDSLGGTLFFNLAHYVLRPWPWIITALCSVIIYPELRDIQAAFPAADPRLIGHDSAFPAMLKFLPAGFVGLMVGGLIAANSSTILTHLNWGASYLVHDFYRRFIAPNAAEKHYVNVGRVCTVALYVLAALLSTLLESAQDAFEVLISIGAGTGLLYLLRWFWWRINAWCEIVAMVSSFAISVVFFVLKKTGHAQPFAHTVLCSVAFTTFSWIVTAYYGAPTSRERLISFYKKVHPAGPGWATIRKEAGVTAADAALHGDHMGLAALGWASGCLVIWSALFAIGSSLYGRWTNAVLLSAVLVASGAALFYVISRLWDRTNPP